MIHYGFQRLMKAAQQDPKKAGILTALVVVMAGMWIKAVGGSDAGPSLAAAAPSALLADEATSANLRTGEAAALLAEWSRAPIEPPGRNLFAVKLDYYPRDGRRAQPEPRPANGENFWDQLAKSMARQADHRRERQILVENLKRQAAELKLQSTMMGEQPKAIVNGELVGEGDVVASFRVMKIEARRIIVERQGILLEILMK